MHSTFIIPPKLLFLFSILFALSCSEDSDVSEPIEITVTTSDFLIIMDENPVNGQVIGTVEGSTNQGSVTFSITEQIPEGALSIDAVSGELKVADASLFDFDLNPVIMGIVKVANGTVSGNAGVIITLNNLNEENIYEGDIILRSQEEVNLFGANQYTRVMGSVTIGNPDTGGTTDIFDLSPLESLNTIDFDLRIINNPDLISTSGLAVDKLDGILLLAYNSHLENLNGLNGLTTVLGLALSTNQALNNLSGLSQITSIQEDFTLISCPSLTDLNSLSNLTTIGRGLNIANCSALTNLEGLSNLRNMIGDFHAFRISNNTSLTNLNGFRNLSANIFQLELDHNPSLINIEGLANINVTNTLYIHDNAALENINGLESITRLEDQLFINDNNSLNNLQGLANVIFANEIHFYRNRSLVNLEGLNNLSENWKMDINGNSQLSDFCALLNLFSTAPPLNFYAVYNAHNPTRQDMIDGNCSM